MNSYTLRLHTRKPQMTTPNKIAVVHYIHYPADDIQLILQLLDIQNTMVTKYSYWSLMLVSGMADTGGWRLSGAYM